MKPHFPLLILPAVLAALFLAPGCDTAPARNPKGTQTVVLSPDQPAPSVTIELVSAIRVVLPGPEAGSGYVWEIASNNTRVLEQMGPLRAIPASAAPGAKATTAVSFYALKPGRSVIRFFLVRPNAAEAVPAASCMLTVHVED
jgi:predicted secreted protein